MKPPYKGRSGSRYRAVQALYQWQLSGLEPEQIADQFFAEEDMQGVSKNYFRELLQGAAREAATLDGDMEAFLDRDLERLDPVEHAVLWVGAYELKHSPNVPWRVAINEAVELAKVFGAEDSHKYVNGVLDKLAQAYGRN